MPRVVRTAWTTITSALSTWRGSSSSWTDGRRVPLLKDPVIRNGCFFSSSKLKCLISKVGSNEKIDRAGSGSVKITGADESKSLCCDSIAFTYKMERKKLMK